MARAPDAPRTTNLSAVWCATSAATASSSAATATGAPQRSRTE